ncbi:MAG: amidase [Alphaproteobacteria bacterium]|nr:amidase [Alphaproteobacteria bacterium]
MADLSELDLVTAARLIRQGELSPVDYVEALLARIEQYDGALDSFLLLLADGARERAETAAAAVTAGETLGPLHGVPYGLKDIIDVAGLPTTAHSRLLADNVAAADATVAARLHLAGGILLGKMATHEFAIGGPSFDLPWPPARNPWNRERYPGGSSSGSGAAVAAGFLPAAVGSDTGGSVRNPASACGIVGIKATYGRVSRHGVVPLSQSLDHVGPMTRTVADNALLLGVMAGHDPADPASARAPVPDFSAGLGQGVQGLRIGVLRHFHTRDMVAADAMTRAIEDALAVLTELGAEIVEIETAPLQDYATTNRIILLCEAYAIHRQWLQTRPEDYGASFRERVLPGAFLSGGDYVDALRHRRQLAAGFDALMRDCDAAIAASSMEPAFVIDDAAEVALKYPRQARTPFNVTGHPALALPIGFDAEGLPLSMQIVGRYFDEAMVYRVAQAYEGATDWHLRRPPLAAAPTSGGS